MKRATELVVFRFHVAVEGFYDNPPPMTALCRCAMRMPFANVVIQLNFAPVGVVRPVQERALRARLTNREVVRYVDRVRQRVALIVHRPDCGT